MKNETKLISEKELFKYGIYCKILNNEKHYTVLQSKYKNAAAYWLLLIFAAIGVVFSSEEVGIPFHPMISTFAICLVGIIGNCCLWYEDIVIQERFLNLNYLEACKLENQNDWLPQLHHKHKVITYEKMLKIKNLFYIGCNAILFIIMIFGIVFYFMNYSITVTAIISFIFLIVFIFISRFMLIQSYKNDLSALKEFIND